MAMVSMPEGISTRAGVLMPVETPLTQISAPSGEELI